MKVYKGLISEKHYQGLPLTVIITKEYGILIIDALVQEFVDNGKVYEITIKEVEEDARFSIMSMPITAERKYVPV